MRRISTAAAAALLALSLATPGALADTGYGEPPQAHAYWMEIGVGKVSLTAKVVAHVDVTLSCSPKGYNEYPFASFWEGGNLQVWIRQASGRSIAAGFSDLSFDPDVMCDGATHPLRLSVSADPSGPPLRGGTAVLAISGYAGYYWENQETWDSGWISHHASTGWLTVRLGR